jgi:hypothetical protein
MHYLKKIENNLIFLQIFRLDEGFESENISEILSETEKVSEDDELYEKDVEDIVYVLEKTKQKTKTQTDRQSFIRSSSNIVSQKKKNVWKNIPVRYKRKAACHGNLEYRVVFWNINEFGKYILTTIMK